jgi:hypothetical protein
MKGVKSMKMKKMTILAAILGTAFAVAPLAAEQSPSKTPAGVAGNWNVSVVAPDGPMAATMALAQNAEKVTGTFNSDHSGEVTIAGQFADGKLTFSVAVHEGSAREMKIEFSGAFKADGTLAGTLSSPMGDMTWTASRAK